MISEIQRLYYFLGVKRFLRRFFSKKRQPYPFARNGQQKKAAFRRPLGVMEN